MAGPQMGIGSLGLVFAVVVVLPFASLIAVLVWSSRVKELQSNVDRLRAEVARLRGGVDSLQVALAVKPEKRETPDPWATTPQGAPPAPAPAARVPVPQGTAPAAAQSVTRAATPQPQVWRTQEPSRTKQEWEALIGEKWLNRVGALALVIGVGFFLKYAFDRNWIPPTVRVLIGLILGGVLVWQASRLREKFQIFAQGLLGAGIAILYLSVYASFNFYRLIPQPAAFAAMSVVTIIAFERATRFDSFAVGMLGWVGGFMTPALLAPGGGSSVGLFVYLIALNAGLLALVALRRKWWPLEPLSLAATYLHYSGWFSVEFRQPEIASATTFLSIIWALYYALEVYRQARGIEDHTALRNVVGSFNLLLYFGAVSELIRPFSENALALIALLLAVAYAAPVLVMRRRFAPMTIKAILMMVVATELFFPREISVPLWALEASALVYVGLRTRVPHVRVAALGVFALSLGGLGAVRDFSLEGPLEAISPLITPRALALLAWTVFAAAAATFYKRVDDDDGKWGEPALNYAWIAVGLWFVGLFTDNFFEWRAAQAGVDSASLGYVTAVALAAVWTCYSVPVAWYGQIKQIPSVHHGALAAYTLAFFTGLAVCLGYQPLDSFRLVINPRFAVLLALIAGSIIHRRVVLDGNYRWSPVVADGLGVATGLLAFAGLTAEARDFFERKLLTETVPSVRENLRNAQQLSISGTWLAFSVVAMVAGFVRKIRGLRLAAIALLGLTILKVFLYDLSFLPGLYRIYSLIALGVILLATSYLYQRFKDKLLEPDAQPASS